MIKYLKKNKNEIIGGVIVITLFILISYLAQRNIDTISNYISQGFTGMIVYTSITIFATVFAPISALPLMPLAVQLWGVFIAAILSIIGWTIGSLIAFLVAKKLGKKYVMKIIDEKKIKYYEDIIPENNLFLGVVILRMFLPVDVLSYVLGLFTNMRTISYTIATLIGVTPFAFVIAYIGSLSLQMQIISMIVGTIMFSILSYFTYKKFRKMHHKG